MLLPSSGHSSDNKRDKKRGKSSAQDYFQFQVLFFSSSYKSRSRFSSSRYSMRSSSLSAGNVQHGIAISLSVLLLIASTTPYAAAQPPDNRDPYNGYARVTPSMAIIIVVLIAALFFMGFFSIYIRHCTDSTSAGSLRPLNNLGRSRRAVVSRGLDPAVIETFPTLVYAEVKGHKIGNGALECAVCLNEFEDHETLRLLPKCDHVFHPECIDEWLASHTTCPVCRANLAPQPGDPESYLAEPEPETDLEAQSHVVELEPEVGGDNNGNAEVVAPEPEVMSANQTLNRNRTRGSRSGRPPKFPRSHTTGHSLVQPGENTERFTLRLPVEVRKEIMNRELNRTRSLVGVPRGGSSRRGYRTGGGDGSSKGGKYHNLKRPEQLDRESRSDRWVFGRNPSFLARASSFLTRTSSSIRSPRVAANNENEGPSTRPVEPEVTEPGRLPV